MAQGPASRATRGTRRVATRRLLVLGRLPEPGRTKTRLIPALGPHGAAELYAAFLDDIVGWAPTSAPTELWVAPRPDAIERLRGRYPEVSVRAQPDGDLGDRLAAAFDDAFRDGIDHVVAFGSDHPTLPPSYLERAFAALHGAHLVLGPTRDGGYYAVGLRRPCWPGARSLFEGAPWSTAGLLEWTRARAAELELCHAELPRWYDVDEPGDLDRLARDVSPESETGRVWRSLVAKRHEIADVAGAPREGPET